MRDGDKYMHIIPTVHVYPSTLFILQKYMYMYTVVIEI